MSVGGLQGGLVDFLQCSQLSGQIPRPPKRGMAAEAEENFYNIMIDKRKVCRHSGLRCVQAHAFERECSGRHRVQGHDLG